MINSELKKMIPLIIEKKLHFNKGNVSGYSIEVEEPNTEGQISYTSFVYYNNEESRNLDFDLLNKLKNNQIM